jgi:hypothetical protein
MAACAPTAQAPRTLFCRDRSSTYLHTWHLRAPTARAGNGAQLRAIPSPSMATTACDTSQPQTAYAEPKPSRNVPIEQRRLARSAPAGRTVATGAIPRHLSRMPPWRPYKRIFGPSSLALANDVRLTRLTCTAGLTCIATFQRQPGDGRMRVRYTLSGYHQRRGCWFATTIDVIEPPELAPPSPLQAGVPLNNQAWCLSRRKP